MTKAPDNAANAPAWHRAAMFAGTALTIAATVFWAGAFYQRGTDAEVRLNALVTKVNSIETSVHSIDTRLAELSTAMGMHERHASR